MSLCRTNHYYRSHAPAATLLGLLLLGSLPTHVPMAAAQQAETQQAREYDIPPGSLGEVLSRFAAEAGILLSGDAALTGQQNSPGLQGRYTVRQALDRLLAGTGVTYRFTGPDTVTLERVVVQEDGPVQLAPITVTGTADNFGQLPVSTANVGETTTATRFPVDSREVPRSVGVVSEQLIEETAARNPGELSAYVSGVSRESNIARAGNFFIRGFPVGVRATIDGLRNPRGTESARTFIVTDLALYEKVEFLKGASSILYGQAEPGGNVNYVSKKPLFERAHSVEGGRLLSRCV